MQATRWNRGKTATQFRRLILPLTSSSESLQHSILDGEEWIGESEIAKPYRSLRNPDPESEADRAVARLIEFNFPRDLRAAVLTSLTVTLERLLGSIYDSSGHVTRTGRHPREFESHPSRATKRFIAAPHAGEISNGFRAKDTTRSRKRVIRLREIWREYLESTDER